jgi:Polyketide cyclase / dehydrase and lipid transport
MGRASESIWVVASLAEAWDLYFDPRGWSVWVDGFQAVESASGYPGAGGTLRWRSVPAGRGNVSERVLEHEPRRRHRIAYEDPQSSGELLTEFAIEGEGVRVTLSLEYRLAGGGPFAGLTDRLFVRGQVLRSLQRTLLRFKHEVEEVAALGR